MRPLFILYPIAAAVVADAGASPDLWSLVERGGTVGILVAGAILLWRKLEAMDKMKMELSREQLKIQQENSEKLSTLLVAGHDAQNRNAEALDRLVEQLKSRPCQLPSRNIQ